LLDGHPRGSTISFFATGAGVWSEPVQDGSVILNMGQNPARILRPAAPVSLTIGGVPAAIRYAGAAPFQVSEMLQVNAVVPAGVGSGTQPLVLTIGQSSSGQNVTVEIE
jgi:uncharacterized protein (TIGR03437 family)